MCLSTVTSSMAEPDAFGVGYKVVKPWRDNRYQGIYYSITANVSCFQYPCFGEEVIAIESSETDNVGERYTTGFHIFKTLKDAISYLNYFNDTAGFKIVRVEYRHVVARGYQSGLSTVCAKYMKAYRMEESERSEQCV